MIGRLFVAVEVPDEARHALAQLTSRLSIPGRLVAPDAWHFTLRFLGDTEEVGFDRLCAGLDQADLGPGFRVVVDHLGAFPNQHKATVVWAGVSEGSAELEDLGAVVEESVQDAGFPGEDRPFRPHLTLSRVRPPADVRSLIDAGLPGRVPFIASQVVVYRSHLGGGRPAWYEPLERFQLG